MMAEKLFDRLQKVSVAMRVRYTEEGCSGTSYLYGTYNKKIISNTMCDFKTHYILQIHN